jgi:hypothetical protein
MSRKVTSLQNTHSHRSPDSPSASSGGLPIGPTSNSSVTTFAIDDWLLLSDLDANQDKQWSLGDVVLSYQECSELLQL